MKKIITIFLISLLFISCSYKNRNIKSKTYLITIKTKNLKFSDIGFLNKNRDYLNLQIFSAGNLIFNIEIYTKICVNKNCFSKRDFTNLYLAKVYPQTLFENVLQKKPILESRNLEKIEGGFKQEIKDSNYNIKYKIEKNNISFRDKKNRILIKLRELKD